MKGMLAGGSHMMERMQVTEQPTSRCWLVVGWAYNFHPLLLFIFKVDFPVPSLHFKERIPCFQHMF